MKKIVVELMSKKDKQQSTQTFVVASTKSKNNLVESLKEDNFVNTLDKQDVEFYLDRDLVLKTAKELSASVKEINANEQELVANAIVSALEVGCLVKRPEEKK